MRSLLFAPLFLVAASAQTIAQTVERHESTNVYQSISDDAILIVTPYGDKDEYLAYFENFESSLDNKAKLYKKETTAQHSEEGFYFRLKGSNQINIQSKGRSILVNGSLLPYIEVLDGQKPAAKMIFRERAGTFEADKAANRYKAYQGLAASKIEANKQIDSARANFEKSCDTKATLAIDWSAFEKQGMKTTPGMLQGHLTALADICGIDGDYLSAIKSIKEVKVTPAKSKGDHRVTHSGDTLSIEFDDTSANVADVGRELILKAI